MLPQIVTPEFETTIPSTGQIIHYRPFLVKEEKILLMALEGGEHSAIISAVNNILKECITEDIDTAKLTYFDFEFLFLQIRIKSVGEIAEFGIKHECGHTNDITLNLDDVKVCGEIKKTIDITEDIKVEMRYPNTVEAQQIMDQKADSLLNLFCDCVVSVYDSEQVFDFEKAELKKWIENLPQKNAKGFIDFFKDMPKLEHEIEYQCVNCKENVVQVLEGLQSFFQ